MQFYTGLNYHYYQSSGQNMVSFDNTCMCDMIQGQIIRNCNKVHLTPLIKKNFSKPKTILGKPITFKSLPIKKDINNRLYKEVGIGGVLTKVFINN